MLKVARDQAKSLFKRLPFANQYLLEKRFGVELALIRGTHKNTNTHPSILHFSVNKAATQYVKSILRRCSSEVGMVNVGIHDYAFQTDFPYLNKLSAVEFQQYQHIFKPQGYTYSVFGGMIDGLAQLDRYRVVLVIRDPRDVLVSGYYSIAYSHAEPGEGTEKYETFTQNRSYAQNITVDDYVMDQCDAVFNTYNQYLTLLLNKHPDVYVTKYEDMIADFEAWLRGLVDYCKFDLQPAVIDELLAENERLKPSKENVKKHIRKGKAGDYKEKLREETIQHIETALAPIIQAFGY